MVIEIKAASPTTVQVSSMLQSSVASSSSLLQYQNSQQTKNIKLFSDNFWGEKTNGFDVLCQNLKHSLSSVKDLENFLRESANCEDTYVKVLNKLVGQINRFSANGTFHPLWSPLKDLNEKYSYKHIELVHHMHELIKEVQKYNEELGKKIKKIRENETQTQNIVQSFQEIQQSLNKSKEQYQNLCLEFEKQKRQLDPQQLAQYQQLLHQQFNLANSSVANNSVSNNNSGINGPGNVTSSTNNSASPIYSGSNIQTGVNFSTNPTNSLTTSTSVSASDRLSSLASSITVSKVSQIQKLEKKLKFAFEEYKSTIDKYNTIRLEFERKLADSCNHFQFAEETHLKQMRQFVESYSKLLANINSNKQQIHSDFQNKFEQFTCDYLLQVFIESKGTGTEKPEAVQFIDQNEFGKIASTLLAGTNFQNGHQLQNTNANNINSINEAEFSLFINGGSSFTNTSLSMSNPLNSSATLPPPPPPPIPSQLLPSYKQNFNISNSLQHPLTSASIDGSDYSIFNPNSNDNIENNNTIDNNNNNNNLMPQSRATPVLFSPSNLTGSSSNGFYSPLTNSVSSTTLNLISQSSINSTLNNIGLNNLAPTSSPTNIQQSLTSPSNLNTTDNLKRGDSKGINIFNVDFLGRNKNKEKKAQKAAAAAAINNENPTSNLKSKLTKSNKKNKQSLSNQYENLNSSNTINLPNSGLSVSNNSNKDSSSINSEDSNEQRNIDQQHSIQVNQSTTTSANLLLIGTNSSLIVNDTTNSTVSINKPLNNGSITARSISSITGSLSFDLLDQLKLSNGSDIDSEGYSIRPESSIGLRRKKNENGQPLQNKDNEDMNNLYASSSTDSDSDDSDSENSSGGPLKVMLKIRPKSEINDDKQQNNAEVLREISKNLQLKPVSTQISSKQAQKKNRAYYYNYGTANVEQASSGWSDLLTSSNNNNSNDSNNEKNSNEIDSTVQTNMTRSVSVGSGVNSSTLYNEFSSSNQSTHKGNNLFDFGIKFSSNDSKSTQNNILTHQSISLTKGNENNLYNIDEDKEVESSFQYDQIASLIKRNSNYVSSSPINSATNTNNSVNTVNSMSSSTTNGRFTPACFPGRTTPDFRHTTSFFEQQSNRASIISPLTINSGGEIIPIAVAFNETIHAYFRMGDQSKFKVKCFGCMKISFPFAILKLLAIELPQLEFRLSNLQIANQDLKVNDLLLNRIENNQSLSFSSNNINLNKSVNLSGVESLQYKFITANLIQELKQQHQQNKLAAFFNFELLKYEFKYSNAPLVLNAHWSSNPIENTIDLVLEYTLNFRKALSQVNFMIVMPLNFNNANSNNSSSNLPQNKISLIKSDPNALVQESNNKLQVLWQMPTINSDGRILAKFSVSSHLQTSDMLSNSSSTSSSNLASQSSSNILEQYFQPVYVKFFVDNETLSNVKFEILSSNYKLSLLKERVETGKYFSNYEQNVQNNINLNSNNSISHESQSVGDNSNMLGQKKAPFAGNLSTSIGSTVDILLNH